MFAHMLLAVDGSEYSGKAVKLGAALAQHFGAEVLVVHVHEHDIGRAASYLAETAVEATALVDGVVADLKGIGVNASGEVR
jgi:nucleotide-binding universal stress UspA family protein